MQGGTCLTTQTWNNLVGAVNGLHQRTTSQFVNVDAAAIPINTTVYYSQTANGITANPANTCAGLRSPAGKTDETIAPGAQGFVRTANLVADMVMANPIQCNFVRYDPATNLFVNDGTTKTANSIGVVVGLCDGRARVALFGEQNNEQNCIHWNLPGPPTPAQNVAAGGCIGTSIYTDTNNGNRYLMVADGVFCQLCRVPCPTPFINRANFGLGNINVPNATSVVIPLNVTQSIANNGDFTFDGQTITIQRAGHYIFRGTLDTIFPNGNVSRAYDVVVNYNGVDAGIQSSATTTNPAVVNQQGQGVATFETNAAVGDRFQLRIRQFTGAPIVANIVTAGLSGYRTNRQIDADCQ